MTQRTGMAVIAGALGGVAMAMHGHAVAQPTGRGLSLKDLQRVESLRGDSGGLSRSMARGPASLAVPNDFSGVYQIPEDADSPYAGWYARASGATIAVFPRGEYNPGPNGMMAVLPANTRFFLGSIPLNGLATRPKTSTREAPAAERVDNHYAESSDAKLLPRHLAPDAPLPATVETAKDLTEVSEAMGKLCNDPIYRANRVRELMERASRRAGEKK